MVGLSTRVAAGLVCFEGIVSFQGILETRVKGGFFRAGILGTHIDAGGALAGG